MLVSILIVFVICWIPRVLQQFSLDLILFSGLNYDDLAISRDEMIKLSNVFKMFSYVNSIVNVFIYYLTSK